MERGLPSPLLFILKMIGITESIGGYVSSSWSWKLAKQGSGELGVKIPQ